jgi:antitoxin (DNA-binding transcriptional repressor) of toxin-antitoxin stability system
MVITNNGKPIALLTPLSDKTLMEEIDEEIKRIRKLETQRRLAPNLG